MKRRGKTSRKSLYRSALYKLLNIARSKAADRLNIVGEELLNDLNRLELIDHRYDDTFYLIRFQSFSIDGFSIQYLTHCPECGTKGKRFYSGRFDNFMIFEGFAATYGNIDLGDSIFGMNACEKNIKDEPAYNTHFLPFKNVERKHGVWKYRIALKTIHKMISRSYDRGNDRDQLKKERAEKKYYKKLDREQRDWQRKNPGMPIYDELSDDEY